MVPGEFDKSEDIKRMKINLSMDEIINVLIEAEADKPSSDRK